jgi:hypothetical protein
MALSHLPTRGMTETAARNSSSSVMRVLCVHFRAGVAVSAVCHVRQPLHGSAFVVRREMRVLA